MYRILFAMLFVLAFAPVAEAKLWKIDYPSSHLTFTGTQTKTPFSGTFGAYQATIDMDPSQPAQAKIDVVIDMASARTGDAQRDQALPGADWFDVKTYPRATFHATKVAVATVSASAPNTKYFTAAGDLTIKGVKKEVEMPFTLEPYKTGMHAKGDLTIDRTAFNVGTGDWASDAYVGRPVTIGVDLIAE